MGVPTMYTYLLSHFNDKMSREEQQLAREAASRLRLTISGSGACPPSLMKQWHGISGLDYRIVMALLYSSGRRYV